MTKQQFDYQDLLVRYIAHVCDCESVTYIDKLNSGGPCIQRFTPEEAEELERLDKLAMER